MTNVFTATLYTIYYFHTTRKMSYYMPLLFYRVFIFNHKPLYCTGCRLLFMLYIFWDKHKQWNAAHLSSQNVAASFLHYFLSLFFFLSLPCLSAEMSWEKSVIYNYYCSSLSVDLWHSLLCVFRWLLFVYSMLCFLLLLVCIDVFPSFLHIVSTSKRLEYAAFREWLCVFIVIITNYMTMSSGDITHCRCLSAAE